MAATARGLDHLIVCPGTTVNEAVTKFYGRVINQFPRVRKISARDILKVAGRGYRCSFAPLALALANFSRRFRASGASGLRGYRRKISRQAAPS